MEDNAAKNKAKRYCQQRVKWKYRRQAKFNIATKGKRENSADNFRVKDIAT